MDTDIITNLSDHALERIVQQPGKKQTYVLQFIELVQTQMNNRIVLKMLLSDGFFKDYFIIFPSIKDAAQSELKPFDIIEAGIVRKENVSQLVLIYEYKLIYNNVGGLIGSPVPYTNGAEYKNGDNKIPEELFFQDLQKNQQLKPNQNQKENQINQNYFQPKNQQIQKENILNQRQSGYKVNLEQENYQKDHFTEIANITHVDRQIKIRGRVIKKGQLRPFKTKDGRDGFVFNITLVDETKTIQGTFFNDLAQKYYDTLSEGNIYSFYDFDVKQASKYNQTNNKLELGFSDKTQIKQLEEDKKIPSYSFNFIKIQDIESKQENETVDIIALIEDPGVQQEIVLKSGETTFKRQIKLKDDSQYAVNLTLWKEENTSQAFQKNQIVIFTGALVKNYMGKQLTMSKEGMIITKIPTELPEFKQLSLYKNNQNEEGEQLVSLGESRPEQNFVKLYQLDQISQDLFNESDNTKMYFSCIAYLTKIPQQLYYDSCINENCNKKVIKGQTGQYTCEKCHKSFDSPGARFNANLKFSDESGSIFVSAMGEEICMNVFKIKTEELKSTKEKNEQDFIDFRNQHLFQEFKLRIAAKKEMYGNEVKIRYTLYKIWPATNSVEAYLQSFTKQMKEDFNI